MEEVTSLGVKCLAAPHSGLAHLSGGSSASCWTKLTTTVKASIAKFLSDTIIIALSKYPLESINSTIMSDPEVATKAPESDAMEGRSSAQKSTATESPFPGDTPAQAGASLGV